MDHEPRQTILYGGAFNPPTVAHATIVKGLAEIARHQDADLWLMPSGERHDKMIMAELAIRAAYVHALLASGETHGVERFGEGIGRRLDIKVVDHVRSDGIAGE